MNLAANEANATAPESVFVVQGEMPPDAVVSSLQALLPTRRRPIARQRLTMLDTFDGRVRRAGARLTQSAGRVLSTIAWQAPGGRGPLATQVSHPVEFVWDLPEGPLQQALTPVIGVRRLLPQAEAEQYGAILEILDERQKTVARVQVESGLVRRFTSRRTWQAVPTIVTLTALRGYGDVYERLVPVIESRPGTTSCTEGVQSLILRRAGVPEPRDFSSLQIDLEPTVRADVGAMQIHRAVIEILAGTEPGLRANSDTEFLHDFRVAVRRTRSLLGQIKEVFPAEVTSHFASEFSWLGRLTGGPRDLDVLLLSLRKRRGEISAADVETLLAYLTRAQRQQYAGLVADLDSDRYRRLLLDWRSFLERPPRPGFDTRNARRPLLEVVAERAWRLSQRLVNAAETIGEQTSASRLHELRIDAKKLRYLIDVTPRFYDRSDLACILGALKKLQRTLGNFNDEHVREIRLLEHGQALAEAGAPASAVLTLGRLAEQSRQHREHLRLKVVGRLAHFRAARTRSACRRALKRDRR